MKSARRKWCPSVAIGMAALHVLSRSPPVTANSRTTSASVRRWAARWCLATIAYGVTVALLLQGASTIAGRPGSPNLPRSEGNWLIEGDEGKVHLTCKDAHRSGTRGGVGVRILAHVTRRSAVRPMPSQMRLSAVDGHAW